MASALRGKPLGGFHPIPVYRIRRRGLAGVADSMMGLPKAAKATMAFRVSECSQFYDNARGRDKREVVNIDPALIHQLLDEVKNLDEASKVQNMKRAKQKTNRVVSAVAAAVGTKAGSFDAVQWSQMSASQQQELITRLTMVRDALLHHGQIENLRDPKDFLQRQDTSNGPIIWLAICGFIFAATLLFLIR